MFGSVSGRGPDITLKILFCRVIIRCGPIWDTPNHIWLISIIPKSSLHLCCKNWGSYYLYKNWPNREYGQGINISRIKRYSRILRKLSIILRVIARSFRSCWI